MNKTTAQTPPPRTASVNLNDGKKSETAGNARRQRRCDTSLSKNMDDQDNNLPADRGACTSESDSDGSE